MEKIYLLNLKIIILVCQFSLSFATDSKVEEGWRLYNKFVINLTYEEKTATFDFSDEHYSMAHILKPPPTSTSSVPTKVTDKKDKVAYLCLMRFTPILCGDNTINSGPSVSLTQEIFDSNAECNQVKDKINYNEIGFLSGHFHREKNKKTHPSQDVLHHMSIIPEDRYDTVISDIFSIKLAQRLFINPIRLEEALNFRYPTSHVPICFRDGNYQKLFDANKLTKENLSKLKQKRETRINQIKEFLDKGDFDEVAKLSVFDSKLDDEKLFTEFFNNQQMNSYTCAEQTALDFLENSSVQQYIRKKIDVNNNVLKAIVVNVYCSHIPCCSCATALAAETLEGGVFAKIFPNKKIILLCSANQWYERSEKKTSESQFPMIPYRETNFLFTSESLNGIDPTLPKDQKEDIFFKNVSKFLEAPLKFDLGETKDFIPYPIVIVEYDPNLKTYEINNNKIKSEISNFSTKFFSNK